MGQNVRNVFRFMNKYSKMRTKALRIKEDEEKRSKSYYFGVSSIITSLFAAVFCMLGAWIFQAFSDSGLVIFTIIIGIGFILCGIILFVWALIRMIFQFTIHANWSGWVSLILFFLSLIASVVGIVMFISI